MNAVVRKPQASRSRFFLIAAWFGLAVALTGFTGTFILPLARGTFVPLPFIFVHGAMLFGWVSLFAAQATLIGLGKTKWHRRLGWLGAGLAIGVACSTVIIGVQAMHRDLAAGMGEPAISGLVGVCTSMLIFLAFVVAGIHYRRRPDVHRRLMLLATIAVLWPAWFRFRHYFPWVPHPEYVFAIAAADSLVLVAMLHDWLRQHRVHPVYVYCGSGLIADHLLETLLFDSPGWRMAAHAVAGVLG